MRSPNLNFVGREIQYVLAIARAGSLTQATRDTGIQQAGLSRALQRLEEELGERIFFRDGRGVRPTPFGERFLRLIEEQSEGWRRSMEDLLQEEGKIQGHLRFGCHLGLGLNYIPHFWPSLSARYPELEIDLQIKSSVVVCEMLSRGELDMGLAANPLKLRRLVIKRLATEEIALYRGSGHGGSQGELLYNPETPNIARILKRLPRLRPRSVPSYDLIARILKESDEWEGLLPSGIAARYPGLHRTSTALDRIDIALVYREDLPRSNAVRAVIDGIEKRLRASAAR